MENYEVNIIGVAERYATPRHFIMSDKDYELVRVYSHGTRPRVYVVKWDSVKHDEMDSTKRYLELRFKSSFKNDDGEHDVQKMYAEVVGYGV